MIPQPGFARLDRFYSIAHLRFGQTNEIDVFLELSWREAVAEVRVGWNGIVKSHVNFDDPCPRRHRESPRYNPASLIRVTVKPKPAIVHLIESGEIRFTDWDRV